MKNRTLLPWAALQVLLLIAVTSIAFVAPAHAQQTISSSFFGFDMNLWYNTSEPWPTSLNPQIHFGIWRSLGASVNWDEIDNQDPQHCRNYNWARLDGYAKQATSAGQDILYTVYHTPPCANGGQQDNVPPGDVGGGDHYWINFINDLMAHAKSNGYHIKYWECWNEPNIYGPDGSWYGTMGQLQQMCHDLYTTVKGTDPSALVLTPPWSAAPAPSFGDDCTTFAASTGWLVGHADDPSTCTTGSCTEFQQYLGQGNGSTTLPGIKSADIISFHSYLSPDQTQAINVWGANGNSQNGGPLCETANVPFVIQHVQQIASAVEQQQDVTPLPIWSTEGSNNGIGNDNYGNTGDPDLSAAFLAQYLVSFMDNGVSNVTWFGYDYNGGYGLLESPGTPSHTLDENGTAYQRIFDWTNGNSITSPQYPVAGTVYAVNLNYQNNPAMIMWDDACAGSGTCLESVNVGTSFTNWQDLDGNVHTISGHQVNVGLKPVLVY